MAIWLPGRGMWGRPYLRKRLMQASVLSSDMGQGTAGRRLLPGHLRQLLPELLDGVQISCGDAIIVGPQLRRLLTVLLLQFLQVRVAHVVPPVSSMAASLARRKL